MVLPFAFAFMTLPAVLLADFLPSSGAGHGLQLGLLSDSQLVAPHCAALSLERVCSL